VFSKIVSKVLMDKGVLSGRREEVLFLVFMILGFVEGDVGKGVEAVDRGRRDRGTGDDICRTVRDVEEWVILRVVKDRPGELGGWGIWDRSNG